MKTRRLLRDAELEILNVFEGLGTRENLRWVALGPIYRRGYRKFA